jgi:pantetheine-phosphate adenylyltransferase
MSKKIVLYAGSFDPITLGHMHVIETVIPVFDGMIINVGVNSQKKGNRLFSCESRVRMINEAIKAKPNVFKDKKIIIYNASGLTVDIANDYRKGYNEYELVAMIRGMRLEADFQAELNLSLVNQFLDDKIPTFWIPPKLELLHVSSSLIRELIQYGRWDRISCLVPECIVPIMKAELGKE